MSRHVRSTTIRAFGASGLAALLAVSCGGSGYSPTPVPSPATGVSSPAPVPSPAAPSPAPEPSTAPTPAPAPSPAPTPTPEPTPAPAPTPTPEPTPAPTPTPAPAPTTVTITILGINGGMSFSPALATLRPGDSVRWHNGDAIVHTATQRGGGFDTGLIAPGTTSAPITLSATGNIDYFCAVHPVMVGTLRVAQ